MIKTYKVLIHFPTFEERFSYLKLKSHIGQSTFGFDRYLNQSLYQSREWKRIKREILIRDDGCDLAIPDRPIFHQPVIHHINPITIEDIENANDCVFDLNNLITTSHETHNAIHFGNESLLSKLPKERSRGDMTPWLMSAT